MTIAAQEDVSGKAWRSRRTTWPMMADISRPPGGALDRTQLSGDEVAGEAFEQKQWQVAVDAGAAVVGLEGALCVASSPTCVHQDHP